MVDIENKLGLDSTVYKTLLESTKAIPWKIDWSTMSFAYIGPQIEQLLGWTPDSWVTANDWAERMHPEDRVWAVDFCISQSKAGVDHEADYRALCKDGRYVWIRDVVHVVRNPDGSVDSLIGFMFDISERKNTEEKLLNMQKELEELSFKDGLTGVANRRRFDVIAEKAWDNAQREQQPLSMIMLDIDYFKQYNDHYGHLQGDQCLKQVARILTTCVTRANDFVGRFGGEEFVLVLPETDATSAEVVAQHCRDALAKAQIAHARSPINTMLTASLGVATTIPGHDDALLVFIETVDRRLYRAKQHGRDCIVTRDDT
jgi:diguanylate cyclase (GGDEF)-like protein/PAS domain S-box-containing protein